MDGIIDIHVHYFPPELERNPATFANLHDEPFWGALMAPAGGVSLQGWLSVDETLKKMDGAGVEKAVLQGWYWQQFETCKLHNRWVQDVMERHSDRFEAFASLIPTRDGRDLEELQWAIDHGFSGVGEVHATAQGFSLVEGRWQELISKAQSAGLPVLLHVTEPVGRDYSPRSETNFRELQTFIEKHNKAPIILAHLGGLIFSHLMNRYIDQRWQHVYFDTAALPLLYRLEALKYAQGLISNDRLLFGSDFPLKLYAKDADQPSYERFLRELREQFTSELAWKKFVCENAQQMLSYAREHDDDDG